MFEQTPNFQLAAITNMVAAKQQKSRADNLENTIDEWVEAERQWFANRDKLNARIRELEAKNAKLEDELITTKCDREGYKAMYEKFIEVHPDSYLRKYSAYKFKDGSFKNYLFLVYQTAFDKCARAMGITNPEKRRAD